MSSKHYQAGAVQWGAIPRWCQVILLTGLLGILNPAFAQSEDEESEKRKSPGVKVERRGGKKVYRLTTGFVIEGRIQKPNAFYVLQRSQINYDWAQLKQDFVPRILDSVRQNPF